uniref:Alpha protein n=1 Tax=Triatoma infestans TaxID=30076 RepID=A0A161ME52_TRIIF
MLKILILKCMIM